MKKYVMITIIIISFVSLAFYALMTKIELNGYQTGFHLKGTYQAVGGIPGDAEYLAFHQNKEAEKNVFYYYKQHDFKDKGNYINADTTNLYLLNIDNSSIDGRYILAGKDKLYIIKDKNVLEYEKISNEVVFINVNKP